MTGTLAIRAGAPVAQAERRHWPNWPSPSTHLLEELRHVAQSGCWSATVARDNYASCEERFAERFAAFHDVPYCVPTVNGTTALRLIMLALGIGVGDEVIVPGLTWVACATSVTDLGAMPVFGDIDPLTGCLDPRQISTLKTDRTVAVMAVHLYCNVAHLGKLRQECDRHGLALIEDCAQSHGSQWGERRVGTIGDAGAFSMHQGKPLTCGEGGAVITSDEQLYRRARQLSNNGRQSLRSAPSQGRSRNEVAGDLQGTNAVLGEFQAAVLLDGLARLDEQVAHKFRNLRCLDETLPQIPGVSVLTPSSPKVTRRSPYHYLVRLDRDHFAGRSVDDVGNALEAELGFPFARVYPPLNVHPLYKPHTLSNLLRLPELREAIDRERSKVLPGSVQLYEESLIFRHSVLLSDAAAMWMITDAIAKVQRLAAEIPWASECPR